MMVYCYFKYRDCMRAYNHAAQSASQRCVFVHRMRCRVCSFDAVSLRGCVCQRGYDGAYIGDVYSNVLS